MSKHIAIAKDFSRYPAGRFVTDGPFSGEKFREECLKPVLDCNESAEIDFNGVRGFGSSFLEEAFGGLVRSGYSSESILSAFSFKAEDESLIDELKEYIADAS